MSTKRKQLIKKLTIGPPNRTRGDELYMIKQPLLRHFLVMDGTRKRGSYINILKFKIHKIREQEWKIIFLIGLALDPFNCNGILFIHIPSMGMPIH